MIPSWPGVKRKSFRGAIRNRADLDYNCPFNIFLTGIVRRLGRC